MIFSARKIISLLVTAGTSSCACSEKLILYFSRSSWVMKSSATEHSRISASSSSLWKRGATSPLSILDRESAPIPKHSAKVDWFHPRSLRRAVMFVPKRTVRFRQMEAMTRVGCGTLWEPGDDSPHATPKNWRRITTLYDRCTHTFFSVACLAVTVIFYLDLWTPNLSQEP